MARHNQGIYQRLGKPVRATTSILGDQRFVSLWTGTRDVVPANAWTYKDPQHRFATYSVTGVPKAIDWAVFADWYDLAVHWRGYVPEGALEGDWWHTLENYVVPMGTEFGIMEKVVEWRMNRIRHLRRYVEALIEELPISSNHVPSPRIDDLSELAISHPSRTGAFHALAKSRSQFVDLAGFFCYLREAFPEYFEDGTLDAKHPPSELWVPWLTQKKTGYILDLPSAWKTHNIPLWLKTNIPIHYPWDESLAVQERFSRMDPEVLQAHDEDLLGPVNPNAVASVSFAVQEGEEYDDWLQNSSFPGYNTPSPLFPEEEVQTTRIEFTITDYEGWDARYIDNATEAALLSELYYFKDSVEKDTLRRYRRIFAHRERKESTLERIGILLPYSTLNYPLSHREMYKFVYGSSIRKERGANDKSLLEHITLTGASRRTRRLDHEYGSDDSRSMSSCSRTSGKRRSPFVREGTAKMRDRSASPARSGQSGSSHHSLPFPNSGAPYRRDYDRRDQSQIDDILMQANLERPSLSMEGVARLESILPSGSDEFPESLDASGRWSAAFLREAVFSFPSPNAEWRIRAWRVQNPSWPTTRLLNAALSFHIPFRLEIPAASLSLFARQKSSYSATELAARPFYSAGYRDYNITFDLNGAGYVQSYLASLATLLMKPNAGAFLFEGSLLSRIAREFAPSDLLHRALQGPSAATTLWNSSFRDSDRDTIREFISPYEERVLIGESLLANGQTEPHSIWPDAHTFASKFGRWQGIWNEACEDWFQLKLGDIHANRPRAQTAGQWRNELRQSRCMAGITADTWRQIKSDIELMDGPSWNGVAVSSVLDLGSPGNQFALPYAQ